jgi:hypothetical protein
MELPFKSYVNHHITFNKTGENHLEIRKAVSRALGVMTCVISGEMETPLLESHTDSLRSVPFNITQYQTRVGSLYFPQQKPHGSVTKKEFKTGVTTGAGTPNEILKEAVVAVQRNASLAARMYAETLRGFGRFQTASNMPVVSIDQFEGRNPFSKYLPFQYVGTELPDTGYVVPDDQWALATDLERSTTQELSGIPVNSSRVIQVSLTGDPANTDEDSSKDDLQKYNHGQDSGNLMQSFLCYTRLLRVWINSVDVAE